MLKEAYMLVAIQLKKARDGKSNKVTKEIPKFKVSDLVLLRNHKTHTTLDARYMSHFHTLQGYK